MRELAKLFHEYCVGSYNGHMAAIPHNPTIHAIFQAMDGGNDPKGFAGKLRKLADAIESAPEEIPF